MKRARSPERRAEIEAQLEGAPFPPAALDVWKTFSRLHNRRGSTGMGPARITWLDLDAFSRLTRRPLAPWEIEIIEACDNAFMAAQASKAGNANTDTEAGEGGDEP